MHGCCPVEEDDDYRKDEREAMAREVTIDGVKLKLSDLFTNVYDAKDFSSRLNLLHKGGGNSSEPSSGMNEDALLGGSDA